MAVLVMFVGALAVGVVDCFRPLAVARAGRFNHVSTVIAGLVLTVASGVIGVTPSSAVKGQQPDGFGGVNVTFAGDQVTAFKDLYAGTYIVVGVVCLMVWVFREKPHELVKNVGLTTLALAVTFVSGSLASGVSPNVKAGVTLERAALPSLPPATRSGIRLLPISAGGWLRHPDSPGAFRVPGRQNHDDLHARVEPRRAGGS